MDKLVSRFGKLNGQVSVRGGNIQRRECHKVLT